ncbi:MAG: hypothetical protein ACE5JX_01740 [Acidobacteriota bacterium]
MDETEGRFQLASLSLTGVAFRVSYRVGEGAESVYAPDFIRVSQGGFFLHWPDAPTSLGTVRVEWSNNPFMPQTWRCECTVSHQQPEGVHLEVPPTAAAALRDWLAEVTAVLNRPQPDAALRTSKFYTTATVVSASGLMSGALAIILPILIGGPAWVDAVSKALLVLMVASIGGFAWLRVLAGREEMKAIGESRGQN